MESMRIKAGMNLHNYFTFEVRDAETNAIKNTARAENIVLYSFFEQLAGHTYTRFNVMHSQIGVGRGTGTLDRTRTALFDQIVNRAATLVDYGVEANTGWVTREISLGVDEYNGEIITEVGFFGKIPGGESIMESHALLQDSEGNPISIEKQNTDVVIIRGVFYVTLTIGTGLGASGIYNTDAVSVLYQHLLGMVDVNWRDYFLGRWPVSDGFECKYWPDNFTTALWLANREKYARINGFYTCIDETADDTAGVWDSANMLITMPLRTFDNSKYPNQVFRTIGCRGGMINLPNHDFFPPYTIEGKSIGTGDGTTTVFNIGVPVIMPNTEVIYIDGVPQVRGTDYTIEYENNCVDMYENFFSCQYGIFSPNVEFGNAKTQPASNNTVYFRRDPLLWRRGFLTPSGSDASPLEAIITAANPVWLDFLEPKRCNIFKVEGPTIPSAQIDNVVIEYSTDNDTWTAVSSLARTGQVYRWDIVEARYWRVYIPDYSWTYEFSNQYGKTVNGITYGATFFLGIQTPGLTFTTPPALNASITADMDIDVIFKTANNILRFQWAIEVGVGEGS